MIYSLRKKFIRISMLSVAAVFLLIYVVIGYINVEQMNGRADTFTDIIAENGGRFPEWEKDSEKPDDIGRAQDITVPKGEAKIQIWNPDFGEAMRFLNPESKASTRFFAVWIDQQGDVDRINTDSVSSITEDDAKEYAEKALEKGKVRGWSSYYRYKVCDTDTGKVLVFVDERVSLNMTINFMLILGIVFIGSLLGILTLIIIFSKRAVKPIAEGYDKQKQFITDANHELKTPLTLILTNLEILEAENGKNEWVDDMRFEGMRMTELVNRLVTLTRMDESDGTMEKEKFNISNILQDILMEFQTLADVRGRKLYANVDPGVEYLGDQQAISQLFSILMDNALKYCDEGGEIRVSLKKKRSIEIRVENTFADVKDTKLDRLFDRFYRSDQARTGSGSFGIGLSIAKSIVEKHKSEIRAYEASDHEIGFEVILKNKAGLFH